MGAWRGASTRRGAVWLQASAFCPNLSHTWFIRSTRRRSVRLWRTLRREASVRFGSLSSASKAAISGSGAISSEKRSGAIRL